MGKTGKDKRDIYYRKAKEEGYRARFKHYKSGIRALQANRKREQNRRARKVPPTYIHNWIWKIIGFLNRKLCSKGLIFEAIIMLFFNRTPLHLTIFKRQKKGFALFHESQLGICCLFQIHQKWVSAVWASCKAWLCLICLQYSIHKATLLLWQALITTSGQIFSPNHPPSLLMLWCIWTPWSDQFFFNLSKCVF